MRDRFKVAAAAYAVYGVVYLAGAFLELTPERMRSFHGVPWWSFYVAGAALIAILPWLIARRHLWLTRILVLGPAVKALTLCWRQGRRISAGEPVLAYDWFFILVAVVATVLLARAGFARRASASEDAPRQ